MPSLSNRKTQAIVVAAGSGTRLKTSVPKPLVKLRGLPIIVYSLRILEKSFSIDGIILVGAQENLKKFQKLVSRYRFKKISRIVAGGATRAISVFRGLESLDDDTRYVLIHDAARPFVSADIVKKAIQTCYKEAAVVAAVPVKSTIKRVNPKTSVIAETLDRRGLWEIQTPQVFRRDIIMKAHRDVRDAHATDDALLVERLGKKVKVVMGDYRNIKITTPEDLVIAESFLRH